MGFESVTYVGPVIEVKKVKKNVSGKETLMVNSKGEEFNNGEVYDPYTGLKQLMKIYKKI